MEFYYFMQGFDFAPSVGVGISGHEIKPTYPCNDSNSLSRSVCKIKVQDGSKGSGVVVATRSDPIVILNVPIYALVLTAGHVTGNIFKQSPLAYNNNFEIIFGYVRSSKKLQGVLIKEFSDWNTPAQEDEKTNQKYALPNDLALIGITSPFDEESDICDTFDCKDAITIVGYPCKPNLIDYCASCLKPEDLGSKNLKIDKAFCNFDRRVYCDGFVLNQIPNDLLIGDYSGTSGMSGSPIFLNGKVCGINIGGATIKYQYEVGQIIGCAKDNRWADAIQILNWVVDALVSDQDFEFKSISGSLDMLRTVCRTEDFSWILSISSGIMQRLAISYVRPSELDHNVAISCFHPKMQEVKRICKNFRSCQIKVFSDAEVFIATLNN